MAALIAMLGGIRATVFAAIALAALSFAGVQSYRLNTAQKAIAIVARDGARAEALAANAMTAASEAARSEEQVRVQAVNAVASAYEQGKHDAQVKGERVAADLRAGAVRLREQWRGCEARRVSGTAADPGEPDANADLRATGAGSLVRVGAGADAWILALQAACKVGR